MKGNSHAKKTFKTAYNRGNARVSDFEGDIFEGKTAFIIRRFKRIMIDYTAIAGQSAMRRLCPYSLLTKEQEQTKGKDVENASVPLPI